MQSEIEPSGDAGPEQEGRSLIMRLWDALEREDEELFNDLVTDDFVMEWPQSGERFSGRDRALAAVRAQDEKPEPAGEPRIIGEGDLWVVMLPLRYGTEISHYMGVFELSAGRIARTTELFGAPFPAKAARARFADPA